MLAAGRAFQPVSAAERAAWPALFCGETDTGTGGTTRVVGGTTHVLVSTDTATGGTAIGCVATTTVPVVTDIDAGGPAL